MQVMEQKKKTTKSDGRTYLKVKLKTLAEESRIIRLEEQKVKWRYKGGREPTRFIANATHAQKRQERQRRRAAERSRLKRVKPETSERNTKLFWSLRTHRTFDVRNEARATHLAYSFIRGRAYKTAEQKVREGNGPVWARVIELVFKYGAEKRESSKEAKDEVRTAVLAWGDE